MTQTIAGLENLYRVPRASVAERLRGVRRYQDEMPLLPLPTLGLLDSAACAEALGTMGGLSQREQKILDPMLRGLQNDEIAVELSLSVRTVKFHVSNILKKLRVTHRNELLRFFF